MKRSPEEDLKIELAHTVKSLTEKQGVFIKGFQSRWLNLPLDNLDIWQNKPELSERLRTITDDVVTIKATHYHDSYGVVIRKILGLYFNIPVHTNEIYAVDIDGKPTGGLMNAFNWKRSLVLAVKGNIGLGVATLVTTEPVHPPFCTGDLPQISPFQHMRLPLLRESSFLHPYGNPVNEYSDVPGVLDKPVPSFINQAFGSQLRRSMQTATTGDLEAFNHFLQTGIPQ
ncbi:hypothetical protein HYU96_03810 [Candidatus Daviesbacteria bacterium]|nr:hypothetical protein [Candidatus Daviesbacteria bacterium]